MSDPAPGGSGADAPPHSETGEIESQTAASHGAFDAMVLNGASDESDIEEIAHGHHEEGLLTGERGWCPVCIGCCEQGLDVVMITGVTLCYIKNNKKLMQRRTRMTTR